MRLNRRNEPDEKSDPMTWDSDGKLVLLSDEHLERWREPTTQAPPESQRQQHGPKRLPWLDWVINSRNLEGESTLIGPAILLLALFIVALIIRHWFVIVSGAVSGALLTFAILQTRRNSGKGS
jgi:hypothetical protein